MQKHEKCRVFIGELYLDGYAVKFCYRVRIIKKKPDHPDRASFIFSLLLFISYKQPHPVHLVVLNETSCLSMFYMIVKISRWVYSPISAIVVGFGLH